MNMHANPVAGSDPAQGRVARIAFAGEFSAGKSTAINALLDAEVLPTQATATQLPPIWIAYGPEARDFALDPEAGLVPLDALDLTRGDLRRYAALRLERPIERLRHAELIDTPGISDPTLTGNSFGAALGIADAVVWCTPANQAWRQTEVACWRAVPEDIRRRSLLLVTRADVVPNARDRAKLERRLEDEARPDFAAMRFFDGRAAARRSTSGSAPHGDGTDGLQSWIGKVERRPDRDEPPLTPIERQAGDPSAAPEQCEPDRPASAGPRAEPKPTNPTAPIITEGQTNPEKDSQMTKMDNVSTTDISALGSLAGFIGACLVDSDSGLMLGAEGGGSFDLETAAAGNTEVVKAKNAAKEALGLDDHIEDILITLGTQYHLIRPLADMPAVFLYLALDKKSANLGMARMQLKKVEATVSI